jgi:hypothetical protein
MSIAGLAGGAGAWLGISAANVAETKKTERVSAIDFMIRLLGSMERHREST